MLNLSSVTRIPKTVFDHLSIINKQIHIEIVLSNVCVCACPSACLCVHMNKYDVFKYVSCVSLKLVAHLQIKASPSLHLHRP